MRKGEGRPPGGDGEERAAEPSDAGGEIVGGATREGTGRTAGEAAAGDPGFDPDALRREFPILSKRTYLNSCSLGALSRRAEEGLGTFLAEWHAMGASAWYDRWLGRLDDLRERAAAFVGAGRDEVALLPSTSAALSVAAESVDYRRRPRVVTTELDFPTLVHQWRVKPEVELVVLRSDDGVGIRPEQFAEVVDERTAFLATSHVFFATGCRQDLGKLVSIARDAGALTLIDGYQAVGQIPVDAGGAGVDLYTWGSLKWLCGGPGVAYLYVRRDLVGALEPRITSWFAHADPFAFDVHRFTLRADARRFELGTPALPSVHTALEGQKLLEEVGIGRIARRNRALTDRLVRRLGEADFALTLAHAPGDRTAIVMVRHPDPPGAVEALAREGVVVDHRPGHVRVSPHVYNTDAEVDRFVEVLARVSGRALPGDGPRNRGPR